MEPLADLCACVRRGVGFKVLERMGVAFSLYTVSHRMLQSQGVLKGEHVLHMDRLFHYICPPHYLVFN